MPIISIYSATYCNADELATLLELQLGYKQYSDNIFKKIAETNDISLEKLQIAIFGISKNFNMNENERQLYLSYTKLELLNLALNNNIIYHGYASLLLSSNISHVLKLCVVADFDFRKKKLLEELKNETKDAEDVLKHDDTIFYNWTNYLFQQKPTYPKLYDIVLPMNKHSLEEAAEIIINNTQKDVLKTTDASLQVIEDEILATKIKIFLLKKKHDIDVKVNNYNVEIYIKKFVIFFEKYKKELISLVEGFEKVKSIEIKISKQFKTPSIIRPMDIEIPQKVLLVDDEIEFVETLSERLKSRSMNPAIAYNGEEALKHFENDPPEVMILDLKMPGINGLEVLEKVKQSHPNTEVIILTGHGSKHEEKTAFELGAFAYLEKPVDINTLSETMKNAYKKVQLTKTNTD